MVEKDDVKALKVFLIRVLAAFVFTLFVFNTNAQEKPKKINYAKEGYVKAKVIKYEVDGCGYLLQLEDKKKTKLAPTKLTDEMTKHGRKVWVKYTPVKKPLMSTCMAGTQIEVIDIQKRK